MSTSKNFIQVRHHRKLGAVVAATFVAAALLVVGAPPANAAGCTGGVLCGWVYNAPGSTGSVLVGADFDGTRATGTTAWVGRGSYSSAGTDWDAFWVPAGYCGRAFRPAGKGAVDLGTTNRIGSGSGKWVKVDNLGAHVVVKRGACG